LIAELHHFLKIIAQATEKQAGIGLFGDKPFIYIPDIDEQNHFDTMQIV
jgi:hypothetical protein